MIFEKMSSCFWKLKLGFWNYGLIHLLDRVGPNIVCRPQTPSSDSFWDFIVLLDSSHDFWENKLLFLKVETRVLELWLDTSSGPSWSKYSFLAPDPNVNIFFEISEFYWTYLMILEKMRSFFVKIGARVPDLWLDTSSGPNWPKCSF